MRLKGRVAIVTGGAKGIGASISEVFSKEGASIVIVDIDRKASGEMIKKIGDSGGKVISVDSDVSKAEDVKKFIRAAVDTYGKLDIIVNNAAIHISKGVETITEEEWDHLININLKGIFLGCKYALPELKKTKGVIINMSSMVGLIGQSKSCAYGASKGGIIAMSKGMALDLAVYGIRVNCVCPGWVQTPLAEHWFSQQEDPEKARKYIFSQHPLGRISSPEEVAKAALFLATDDSSFITGIALPVDGALTLGY